MRILSSIIFALSLIPASSQAVSEKPLPALHQELQSIQEDYQIPAIAMAVIADGKVVFADGAGFLDQGHQQPVSSGTLFRLASISKLFTAQAVMQLVEAGKLQLDDRVSTYLPELGPSDITIRELLSHVSGLRDQVRPVPHEAHRRQAQYLKAVGDSLATSQGQKVFNYSDTGFNLLGAVVGKVSGMPFDQYIKRHILVPAGMSSSGYYDGVSGVMSEALPTYEGKPLPRAQQRPYDPAFFPCEGLVSNVSDLANWLVLTLAMDKRLLTQRSYQEMLKPRAKTPWGDIDVGLGWQLYQKDGQLVARHPGSIRGYKSLVLAYPGKRNALVLLTNASKAPRFKIAERFTNKLVALGIWQ
ncbi:serine hydrolase [Gallaecimonas kandeliae]|uniref:serine hydrolase domain-containing protein n=1 Tax=Gallaecimonas kandeliae TaxID=3029055 RepID=UPI0026471C67|nr:serine hydrolase domain-containing protein [Gallaecimonas kandeliae]WKE64866.1 serine hydrolase [Gallaecimonas kandeliae]